MHTAWKHGDGERGATEEDLTLCGPCRVLRMRRERSSSLGVFDRTWERDWYGFAKLPSPATVKLPPGALPSTKRAVRGVQKEIG